METIPHVRSAAEKRLTESADLTFGSARKLYQQDRRFTVTTKHARLEGILQFSEQAWAGWSRRLRFGEVITCEGWKPGMGTDLEGVNWSAHGVPDNAIWVQVWPMSGLFLPYPMKGLLEPLDEEEER